MPAETVPETRVEHEAFGREERARRAWAVIALFAVATALATALLTFPQDIQTSGLAELQSKAQEARDFFTADYVFIVLYGLLGPVALWRFGRAIGRDGHPPLWLRLGILFLAGGGIVDALENTLIVLSLQATGDGALVAAHALAIPKYAFAFPGFALALVALVRAIRSLATR
ncbi:MAG TPA: hypothetical protein VEO00_09290 [Actinomycetota bacterium]|nr:hypothetical protein [Actinomycetota bacterium]